MISPNLLTHRWICVLPLVVLLVFVGFYVIAQGLFVECRASAVVECQRISVTRLLPESQAAGVQTIPSPEVLQRQYSGRMTWLFFALTNVLVCIFAIGVFALIASNWLDTKETLGLMALAFVLGALVAAGDTLPFVGPFYRATVEASDGAGIKNFVFLNRLIHLVATAATFAMVFVVCGIIFGKTNRTNNKKSERSKVQNDSIDTLSLKRNHLKIVLYMSTVLLIIGLLRADQGSAWAVTFVDNPDFAEISKTFFRTVTATLGGFYTLLLAAVYIPAAFIIHERARLALVGGRVADGAGDVDSKLEERGFKFSFAESLPRILAIAAPLLTGPIAEFLKGLTFGAG